MKIKFKKLTPNAIIPTKAHATDAGFDLVATSRVFDEQGCADQYGNGCKQGLLLPLVLMMSGRKQCPKYNFKNKEQ